MFDPIFLIIASYRLILLLNKGSPTINEMNMIARASSGSSRVLVLERDYKSYGVHGPFGSR